jgi:hypothetical protein
LHFLYLLLLSICRTLPLLQPTREAILQISEKLRRISDRYNIRAIFKTRLTLRSILVLTRPERDLQRAAHCVCSIPSGWGRNCKGETGRPLVVRIQEHRQSLKERLLEKSRLAQHAYEEDHRMGWNRVKVLQMESNSRYRKCKKAGHMTDPTIQPNLKLSSILSH